MVILWAQYNYEDLSKTCKAEARDRTGGSTLSADCNDGGRDHDPGSTPLEDEASQEIIVTESFQKKTALSTPQIINVLGENKLGENNFLLLLATDFANCVC